MTLFIDINDLRINYIDEGEDNGRGIILLLHGWGSNITLFKDIVDMLSPHMRVVAPDMAGFGESDEPKKPWCVDDYVDFIGTFCKKLGIVPTVVLGHSFGGRVIIKAVTREKPVLTPEKIILTDSAGIKPKQSVSSKIKTRTYKIGKAVMSTAPMKKLFPNAVENMRNKRGSADYLAASPVMRATLVKVVNEDLTYLLPEIKQSTLLIWGDKDDATPLSDGVKMSELIKTADLLLSKVRDTMLFLRAGTHSQEYWHHSLTLNKTERRIYFGYFTFNCRCRTRYGTWRIVRT